MLNVNSQMNTPQIVSANNKGVQKTKSLKLQSQADSVQKGDTSFKGYNIKGGMLGDVAKHLGNVKTYDEVSSGVKLNFLDNIKALFKGKYNVLQLKKTKAFYENMSAIESQKSILKALDEVKEKVKSEPFDVQSDSIGRSVVKFKNEPVILEVYEPHFTYGQYGKDGKYSPNFSVILKNTKSDEDIVTHTHSAGATSRAFNLFDMMKKK